MHNLFQWPEPVACKFKKNNPVYYNFKNYINKEASKSKTIKIEKFFSTEYKSKYALLCPSLRASINIILKYKNYNRSNTVNVPLWTSACLLHSLTGITNVSVKSNISDSIIVVHKWGHTFKLEKNPKKKLIIDCSNDSMPGKNYKPFENNSNYEVISLPKIIGSYCGGIILTNDKKFYKYYKKIQFKFKKFAFFQSKKKFISSFVDKKNVDWRIHESYNYSLDYNSVECVYNCLSNFHFNKNLIIERQNQLKRVFKNLIIDSKRIGPCLVFKFDSNKKMAKVLELKHFNFKKNVIDEKYSKCLILPLHFGISDKKFQNILSKLKKYS